MSKEKKISSFDALIARRNFLMLKLHMIDRNVIFIDTDSIKENNVNGKKSRIKK